MEKIDCNLKNCYGIKKMQHQFDFTETNAIAVYAKNGLMKTSFSKTFRKIQENKKDDVKDEIFNVQGTVDVKIDGNSVNSQNVFVIKSFESSYESSNLAHLLVNDEIKLSINSVLVLKEKLLKLLEKQSGLKIMKTQSGKKVYELEPKIIEDFEFSESSFLLNLRAFTEMDLEFECSYIKYSALFDPTVIKKIVSSEFQEKLDEFCTASDAIYAEYDFLLKGNFTLPRLKDVCKTLESDNFFVRDNQLHLQGGYEIKELADLKNKITELDDKIKEVPEFKEIEKMLSDAKGTILKEIIENHPEIIEYLKVDKLEKLKKQLWLSYIQKEESIFVELLTKYEELEEEIETVDLDDTLWQKALSIFQERFTVPYKMEISNIKGTIIGESLPRVEFIFEDGDNRVNMNRDKLESIDVLSQGERRALYLLNIIFDIERLKQSSDEILFVIDDIADSFDYKNKYSIIEYLCDIANINQFKLIILSHNFDFYRAVSGRLSLGRSSRLCAEIRGEQINLEVERYQNNPFEYWKTNLENKNVLALIPFVRNLIQYGVDKKIGDIDGIDSDFLLLTNLLHEKAETSNIKFNTLKIIYENYLGYGNFKNPIDLSGFVIDKLWEVAEGITSTNSFLEDKIVLAIAIRHLAERFMINEILNYQNNVEWKENNQLTSGSGAQFIEHLENASNQTRELYNVYTQFGTDGNKRVLSEVNIMTPENIHLNSFMYEPILDMDINELLNLYGKVKSF